MTQIAVDLGAELRDFDALQYHPNGGAWPQNMQGYSIPETTRAYGAVLLNADGEEFTDSLGPRDAVSQAIFDEVEKGKGVETPDGRPAVYLDTTRIAEDDANVSLPYMLRRYRAGGIDPLQERILTYPVLHYQNGGLVIDADATDDARRSVRLRRDRRRHARTQSHDGQLTARVLRVRTTRGKGGSKQHEHDHDDRSRSGRRRRGGVPVRLGAEGHPAGPARRARRRGNKGDVGAGPARAADDPQERPDRRHARRTSSARTPASPSTRAASASIFPCIRREFTRP